MKKFEAPILEIEKLSILDVITTSGCDMDHCWTDAVNCPDNTLSGGM